jgi:hypothetical protein
MLSALDDPLDAGHIAVTHAPRDKADEEVAHSLAGADENCMFRGLAKSPIVSSL